MGSNLVHAGLVQFSHREREQQGGIDCPRCGDDLSLHQPDIDLVDRWLGTCSCCKSWFLIDCRAGVMLPLPDDFGEPEA